MEKKSVFKSRSNEDNAWADLQLKDKEFQIMGAFTLNALQEQTSFTHGALNNSWSDERSDLLGTYVVLYDRRQIGWHSSWTRLVAQIE